MIKPYAFTVLNSAIDIATSTAGAGEIFGGRVWLTPRWYDRAVARGRANLLAFSELSKAGFGWPHMLEAACIRGPIASRSGISWVVGKGMIGNLIDPTESADFHIFQHASRWPRNIDTMTEREWSAEDGSVRRGRSLAEARRLKSLYGTAIGAPIRLKGSLRPIGCITIHTKAEDALGEYMATQCAEPVIYQSGRLAEQIETELGWT